MFSFKAKVTRNYAQEAIIVHFHLHTKFTNIPLNVHMTKLIAPIVQYSAKSMIPIEIAYSIQADEN